MPGLGGGNYCKNLARKQIPGLDCQRRAVKPRDDNFGVMGETRAMLTPLQDEVVRLERKPPRAEAARGAPKTEREADLKT
jgi:hypothetical protein